MAFHKDSSAVVLEGLEVDGTDDEGITATSYDAVVRADMVADTVE